jgi:hypothetical protein
MSSDIPIRLGDLESIVHNVARDLIEERAINGSIDGVTPETIQEVVEDVSYIINRYMYYFNEILQSDKLGDAQKLETKLDFE